MTMGTFPGYANVLGGVVSFLSDLGSFVLSFGRGGAIDLRGKVSLLDNDELLLVWEPELRTIRIKKEEEAIRHAINTAKPGSFLTLCSDVVPDALALVMKLKEEEEQVAFSKEDIPNRNKELV